MQPKTSGLNLARARLRRFDDGIWTGTADWYGDHGYRVKCQTQATGIGDRLRSYEDAYISICREVFSHGAAIEYVGEREPRLVLSDGTAEVRIECEPGNLIWHAMVKIERGDIQYTVVTPRFTYWKQAWIEGCETAFANHAAVTGVYGDPPQPRKTPEQLIRARNLLREYEREARHKYPPMTSDMVEKLRNAVAAAMIHGIVQRSYLMSLNDVETVLAVADANRDGTPENERAYRLVRAFRRFRRELDEIRAGVDS